jgi:hypothetical protein
MASDISQAGKAFHGLLGKLGGRSQRALHHKGDLTCVPSLKELSMSTIVACVEEHADEPGELAAALTEWPREALSLLAPRLPFALLAHLHYNHKCANEHLPPMTHRWRFITCNPRPYQQGHFWRKQRARAQGSGRSGRGCVSRRREGVDVSH